EPDLQARDVGKNKASRINRNHLRLGEDFLRAASRHLLATNRSHPGRRSVHRYRTELSRRDLLWQRRGKENCRGFKRQTHAFRKIQKNHCDRNFACDEILARRRLSPEILPGEPGAFRSFRRRLRPRLIQKRQVGRRTIVRVSLIDTKNSSHKDAVMLSEALRRNAKHEARLSNISVYFCWWIALDLVRDSSLRSE